MELAVVVGGQLEVQVLNLVVVFLGVLDAQVGNRNLVRRNCSAS
jgi:hypothetical protein